MNKEDYSKSDHSLYDGYGNTSDWNKVAQLLFILAGLAIIVALNACTLTVHPDGSRTYGTDAETAAIIAAQIIDAESGK